MEPAQSQEIPEGRKGITEERHPGIRGVEPEHRDFRDGETAQPRQIQDLHVVGESVDSRAAEEIARDVAAEELEATLRVSDSGDREHPHEQVAGFPEKATVEGLLHAHEILSEPAGTDRDGM